ncbi:natriuretic peptides A [Genypterus blacodes]|uniref:natriuretic peptides A n=1 Tax=Genypterus blacodes TaxID=154954 RepID=UPI003F7755EB
MRTVALWVLLVLLCQHTLVSSHSLTGDLAQLKSLLELFEDSLAEGAQEEASETDYDVTKQAPGRSQTSRGWSVEQEEDQEALIPERSPLPVVSHNRTPSLRSRLQDLLVAAKKRSSGCFGGRMDRIGNASGLGCNSGRGKTSDLR